MHDLDSSMYTYTYFLFMYVFIYLFFYLYIYLYVYLFIYLLKIYTYVYIDEIGTIMNMRICRLKMLFIIKCPQWVDPSILWI